MKPTLVQMVQVPINGRVETLKRSDAEELVRALIIILQRNPDGSHRAPEPENIKIAVCLEFGIKPEEMADDTRKEHISFPRQVAMWLCCEHTGMTLEMIGRHFPRKGHARDHGTVLHACRTVAARMNSEPAVCDRILALHKRIAQTPMTDTELLNAITDRQMMINCRPAGVTVIEPDGQTTVGPDLREVIQTIIEKQTALICLHTTKAV